MSNNFVNDTVKKYHNFAKSSGKTPLMICCFYGDIERVKQLLKDGVDLNIKNEHGYTALDLAIDRKRLDITNYIKFHQRLKS